MMAKILLAASPEPAIICKRILGSHELDCVHTMQEAEQLLREHQYDLILCTVVFDESRMFDFLRLVRENESTKTIPLICAVVRPMYYPPFLSGLETSCKMLGASAFIDMTAYSKNPDQEFLSDIESFLPPGVRRPHPENSWQQSRGA